MILPQSTERPPTRDEALALLEDTAKTVKIMKASWLRVAMNLRRIREFEIWKLHAGGLKSFEDYVFGVLEIPRGVLRRMLDAMEYTRDRRPELLEAVRDGRDDVHIPSYDVLNQLRRAAPNFEGRDDDFRDIETKVYGGELGRTRLEREIRSRAAPGDDGDAEDSEPGDRTGRTAASAESAPWDEAPADTLRGVLTDLQGIEARLVRLEASKEVRQLLFRLIEALQADVTSRSI
jgi:hypothetical protein